MILTSMRPSRRLASSLGALALGSLGALSGCGGGDEPGSGPGATNEGPSAFLPPYTSGSRLRAVTVGEPGSSTRRFVTWYDSELETECSFLVAEDGELRCLPLAQSLTPGFADAACTESVYYDSLVAPCEAHPPYRHETLESEGCNTTRVIRMQQESLDSVYHEACGDEPVVLTEGTTVWSDAETLEPTAFVAGNRVQRLNAAGFGVTEIQGEDGSRLVTHITEETFGNCSPRTLADDDRRCIATNAAFLDDWWYADDACSGEPLAYGIPTNGCGEPRDVELGLDVTGGNYDAATVVRVGPPVEGAVYEDSISTGMCEERDAAEVSWSLHPVEGPLDAEELLAVSQTAHGDGRIQTYHNAIDDVTLTYVAGTGLFDSELDIACTALRTSGGGWVCLPEGSATTEQFYFADDACSELVAYTLAEAVSFVAHVEQNFCVREGFADVVLEAYEAVESYAGPLYHETPEGDCELIEQEAGEGHSTVRPVELAELDETRE